MAKGRGAKHRGGEGQGGQITQPEARWPEARGPGQVARAKSTKPRIPCPEDLHSWQGEGG